MKWFKYFFLVTGYFFSSCGHTGLNRIKYRNYNIEGDIKISAKDTILNGEIKFYGDNNKLKMITHYKNGLMHGLSKVFYDNGREQDSEEYYYGESYGSHKMYDSSGNLMIKSNFFHGLQAGPQISYGVSADSVFTFTNLEGSVLFTCHYDGETIAAKGSILNYVVPESSATNNSFEFFLYVINPPDQVVNYKIYDKNIGTGDSSLIRKINASDGFFYQGRLLRPRIDHKYYFKVEIYSLRQKRLRNDNILPYKREMYVPPPSSNSVVEPM